MKRTFVTAHQLQLQQQKKNGKIPRPPQLEKVLQVPVNKKGTTKRKLDLQNDIQDDIIEVKKTRDKEIVECPPVNEYELGRLRRVQENKEKFKELGLGKYAANPNLPKGDKYVQSGTIAAYIALRESQRKDLEGDRRICDVGETSLPNADEEADEEVQPAPKKRR
ncbi:hypothetical protein POM88_032791 [Heracleum sosnowskyi]|uniref:Uncharacterized protein n=1 Tax=Heracleum sosnowskyi TaxID=360622 RepID=A0AAD8I0U8_9APIA|nr:hypothetical protein POM88_032791 [Heracleum sosnowskyi]